MIKIGITGIKDIRKSGNIAQVLKGTDLIWEKSKIVFEGSVKSVYIINISNAGALKPGKTYTFTTNNPYDEYVISSGDKEYIIKNGDTFTADHECEIKIKNTNYTFFDTKIYEGSGSADIKLEKPEPLIYTKSGSSYYDISINNWSDIQPNKNYRFITNKGGRYSIFSGNGAYTIRNKDVFRVNENCDIKIRNTDYNLFELKIYETTDTATIIF